MTEASFEALLAAAWRRSDDLFALVPEASMGRRPIAQRHPFSFYLGHLPAFAWNQIGRGVLGLGPMRSDFDVLFERGIDPADEDGARAASRDAWPAIAEVIAYRDEVRRAVRACIPDVLARAEDVLGARGRILQLVIEHERMHHETLMYMLQEHGAARRPDGAPAFVGGGGRAAEPRHVPAGRVVIGADFEAIPFGWDNEFGRAEIDVPGFTIDSLPVRNGNYLAFLEVMEDGARAALTPRTFVRRGGGLAVKTIFGPVSFEVASGWPAQVSGEQARAYAAWRGGRLATEAELRRAAFGEPSGGVRARPWGHAPGEPRHGQFGFRGWSPVPTGSHPDGASAFGVEELVGNGWEWTSTPFAPLPGFVAYARTYPGYSADFFDGEHDVVFGASWATDEGFLRPSFRNWYRRDYPYVFSSFRVVREEPRSRRR
ncbi:SUMF1/EgtB/PvdO family nonheme iron enzyme [Sorangium sp. So ce448]|uniref:SUMF1/EgtB/PvdO family nonheme iron enzyme n=1 Tax=Sorangium sp. So ce448 TaxID=3133314 RepID=UPI003F638CEF